MKALALLGLGACVAGGGMGPDTRADIAARMQSVQPALSQCYAATLESQQRPVQGIMVLDFAAEPQSGQFAEIAIAHDEIRNPNVRRCVVNAVSQLHLARPTSTRLVITYPIRFSIARSE